MFRNISAYQRATRYVVTAEHCGTLNSVVSVGGRRVGVVSWVDPAADLELVKIDPEIHGQPICAPTSSGFHCSGTQTYTPRAVGRILMSTLRYRSLQSTPVAGTGAPGDNEIFCISGKSSGESCEFTSTPWLPRFGDQHRGEVAARGDTLIFPGDSGAPVSSPDARIYGIAGETSTGPSFTIMKYTRIIQFLEDAGTYALAPS